MYTVTVAGAVALLCLAALAAQSAVAGDLVREAFRAFAPAGFVYVALTVLVVVLALALPSVRAVADPVLARGAGYYRAASSLEARGPFDTATVVLALLVGLAAVAYASLALAKTVPIVLGDELLYVDLAKSIATTAKPLLRGELDIGYSVGFPLFASAAYRLASDGAAAYSVLQAMNSVAFALAAVPAYLFARRGLDRSRSMAIAALTIAVPWVGYPAYAMTESLFYPVLLVFAAALGATLDRPTAARQIGLLASLFAAVLIRPQAVVLGAAVVLSIAAQAALTHRWRACLRSFAITVGALASAAMIGLLLRSLDIAVPGGGYAAVLDDFSSIWDVLLWASRTLGIVSIALGIVTLIVLPVALASLFRRERDARDQHTAIVIASVCLSMFASVVVLSASPYGLDVLHERNLFYVAPLILTGMLCWARDGFPRPFGSWIGVAVVLLGIGVLVADPSPLTTNAVDSPTAAFLSRLGGLYGIGMRAWLVIIAAVAIVFFVTVRHTLALVAWSLVFAIAIASSADPDGPFDQSGMRRLAWVDHALPSSAAATLLHVDIPRPDAPCAEAAEYEQQGLLLWTEFFNTNVDDLLHVYGTRGRDNLPAPLLEVGEGGILLEDGRPISRPFVVVDSRQQLVGTPVARFELPQDDDREGSSLTLWETDSPLRLGSVATPFPPRGNGRPC